MAAAPELVDTHCHLGWESYREDLEVVLRNARAAGVTRMLTIGIDLPTSRQAVELARILPGVRAAVGIHPNDVQESDLIDIKELEAMARQPEVVAIGETGLDFYRDNTPPARQEAMFRRFIQLARDTGQPLVIHCREAYDRCLKVLREERFNGLSGVMHCYAGTWEQAQGFMDLGLHIAFGGVVTFANAAASREVAGKIPLERLLLETDAPFLAPHPFRGKRNEPAYMVRVAETLSELQGMSYAALADATTANARRLFRLT